MSLAERLPKGRIAALAILFAAIFLTWFAAVGPLMSLWQRRSEQADRAADMIARGCCTVLASDYYYPAPLLAAFRLAADKVAPLAQAWAYVSANPARAARLADRGRLAEGLDVYLYADYYVNNSNTAVPFMGTKEVVLSGPGVEGVKAFGAIQDIAANLTPIDIFTKMFDENDPSARFILSQSAPLMIPVNPNVTLKATVLE